MPDSAPPLVASPAPVTAAEPDLVLRRGIHLWPLGVVSFVTLALCVPAALVATVLYPYCYLPFAAVVGWKLTRRPTVRLGMAGITTGRRTIPWSAIAAVENVSAARSRFVRILVNGAWIRVPALRTSRWLPGRGYPSRVAELARYLKAFAPHVSVVDRKRNVVAWVDAVLLALVVFVLLSAQDPGRYWLPRPEVINAPGPCDVGRAAATRLGLAPTVMTGGTPTRLGVTTHGCAFWGDNGTATVIIQTCPRAGVVSGTGIAHLDFEDSVLRAAGASPFGVAMPADEWRIVAIVPAGQHEQWNVIVQARKANVIVTVFYTSRHDGIVTWTGNTIVTATDRTDINGAAAIAAEVLEEIALG